MKDYLIFFGCMRKKVVAPVELSEEEIDELEQQGLDSEEAMSAALGKRYPHGRYCFCGCRRRV